MVVQLEVVPAQQVSPAPSSQVPLQSSSRPLQVSAGGEHASHEQAKPHWCVPVIAPAASHAVWHGSIAPTQQVLAWSQTPLQSLSIPSQTSGTLGEIIRFESTQSVFGTPPTAAHIESPNPSMSASRVWWVHTSDVSSQVSVVQLSASSHALVAAALQTVATQVSMPLQNRPSWHSESFAHTRGGQPRVALHVEPVAQRASSGVFAHAPATQVSCVHATPSSQARSDAHPASVGPVSGPAAGGVTSTVSKEGKCCALGVRRRTPSSKRR